MSVECNPAASVPALKSRRLPTAVFASDLRRACDVCRQGKLRCDGAQPCVRCKKHNRECVYLQAPKKRGRRVAPGNSSQANASVSNNVKTVPQILAPHIEDSQDPLVVELEGVVQRSVAAVTSLSERICDPMPSSSELHIHNASIQSGGDHWHSGMSSALAEDLLSQPEHLAPSSFTQLPAALFLPYVRLFFKHLHPIMPVMNPAVYLHSELLNQPSLSNEDYQLLCALAGATVVQLGLYSATSGVSEPLHGTDLTLSGSFLVNECLENRRLVPEFISMATTSSVITSFFLFSYYGNLDQHAKAWYYLREAITFAQLLGLEDEAALTTLEQLDQVTVESRRRLFWLLFITERAYALQRRLRTTLRPTVPTPAIFESEDPQLLYGFVSLANVYRSVDELFVELWMGKPKEAGSVRPWLVDFHHSLDTSYTSIGASIETHALDIAISREWLHILAWQLSVKQNFLSSQSNESVLKLDYPVHVAQGILQITSNAKQEVLDAHGIGLEQKLTDTADCIINLLKHSKGAHDDIFRRGRETLQGLFHRLGHMRGSQSRYLPVLMTKMNGLLDDLYSPFSPVTLMLTSPAYMPWSRLSQHMVQSESYTSSLEYDQYQVVELPPADSFVFQ